MIFIYFSGAALMLVRVCEDSFWIEDQKKIPEEGEEERLGARGAV